MLAASGAGLWSTPDRSSGSVATLSLIPSCPICGVPLRGRQKVCSPKCRIQKSMQRRAAKRTERDAKVRLLLKEAIDILEEP